MEMKIRKKSFSLDFKGPSLLTDVNNSSGQCLPRSIWWKSVWPPKRRLWQEPGVGLCLRQIEVLHQQNVHLWAPGFLIFRASVHRRALRFRKMSQDEAPVKRSRWSVEGIRASCFVLRVTECCNFCHVWRGIPSSAWTQNLGWQYFWPSNGNEPRTAGKLPYGLILITMRLFPGERSCFRCRCSDVVARLSLSFKW